jgi:GNAT superfamily N-acetyltransferase
VDITVTAFDGPIEDPALHAAYNSFDNAMLAELDPGLGSRPRTESAVMLSVLPSDRDRFRWFAMHDQAVLAAVTLDHFVEDTANAHLGWFDGGVLPDFRRQGLGTQLLRCVAERAQASGRSTLMTETSSTVASGAAFMAALGFEAGLTEQISECAVPDLQTARIEQWIARGRAQADRFELVWVDGRWPEDMRAEVVRLSHVMNDAPTGDLDFNDQAINLEQIIGEEDEVFARGMTRRTLAVRERATGRLVGYTQLYINPSFPDLGQQANTGVFPEFRGHGLGKWIKAEMAQRVLADHPEITRIRTGNANSNAPMLAINHAMGFTLHHIDTVWQIATERLIAHG